jgi:hypothetical protein
MASAVILLARIIRQPQNKSEAANGVIMMSQFSQTHHLEAQSLITGSPAIGQPAFGQVHYISASLNIGTLPPFGHTPEEIGFEKALTQIISASPDRRTKSIRELVELGRTFGLADRKAKILRELVIHKLAAKAWSRAGAPKRLQVDFRGFEKSCRVLLLTLFGNRRLTMA